jgi:ATP-binding cassette subfamily C (CFTR/MRP) protein 1
MLKEKTRILVTHHVEVAKHADIILVMDQGRIIQQGSFDALREAEGTFKTLMDEYGNDAKEPNVESITNTSTLEQPIAPESSAIHFSGDLHEAKVASKDKVATKLHLDEERQTGAVSGKTYVAYLRALFRGGPFIIALVTSILTEGGSIALTLILSFWATLSLPGFSQSHYMGLYAGLGVAMAIFAFVSAYTISLCGLGASFLMAQKALHAVLRSPVSFHDRTPSGRIVSRLTRDVEALDQRLSERIHYIFGGILSIFGTMGLVFYSYPYLGIMFLPMFGAYWGIGMFYARSSRQLRRIDSITRSYVYSTFGEQLAGVATIRAYQQEAMFIDKFDNANDDEGRFYYSGHVIRIWLALRLDLLGSILILGIGIFGVCFRNNVAPSKLAVVLTYSLQTTTIFSELIMVYTRLEKGKMSARDSLCVY